ncbi:sperm motility kinase 3A-like [Phyllostomus discolor]|uniref:non-specific serine/threonine protein kinase n=1 Tax=Phyllostomus discolor TaxID=89673 RepID=A0A6J2MNJ1_9CHIR|nr:sperm motility kinase 3A-like [Phyllostomus discolor]
MPEDVSSASDQECRIGGYLLLRTIGQGSSAKVMLARHIVTGTEVAVKILNKWDYALGFREFQCLRHLTHPNIMRLFEVRHTEDQYFLFVEHLSGGDLATYLQKHGACTEEEARTIFRQLVSALHHCHEKGFAHRDLKPENILLDADNNVKLADFGLSKEFWKCKLTSFCGTMWYVAPEILSSEPYDGQRVDIWSLGVVLYQLVTGKLPFEGGNFWEVQARVLTGHFLLPHFLSEECQHLLQNIMTLDPAQRPTLDAIIKDPWVNRGQKEGVKLYSEPLCGDIDPQISEQMKQLGYDQEDVRESVAHKTFDHIMGTYLILRSTNMNNRGHTVSVRPCSSPEQRQHLPTMPELRAAGEKTNRSTSPPTKVPVRVPVRATSMAPRGTVSTPSMAHRVAIPTTGMKVKLAVPSASSQGEVATPTSSVPMELAVPSASSQGEGATPTSSVPMELAVPSASSEAQVATPTSSEPMELVFPSITTEPEVVITTSSLVWRVDVSNASGEVKGAIKPEGLKSSTLTCPESSPATTSPAHHHGSFGSFTTASSAIEIGSSGSRTTSGRSKSSTRSTSRTGSTSSSNHGSSSHQGEGRQQGPRRLLTIISLALQNDTAGCSPSSAWPSTMALQALSPPQVSTAERLFRLSHYTQASTPERLFQHSHQPQPGAPEWFFRLPPHLQPGPPVGSGGPSSPSGRHYRWLFGSLINPSSVLQNGSSNSLSTQSSRSSGTRSTSSGTWSTSSTSSSKNTSSTILQCHETFRHARLLKLNLR